MRRRLAAALAVFALAAASVPAAYGAEDDQDRTVLYEGPNAVTIPYLDDVEAQPAEGWRFVDCPAVMAQSALVVSCDEERFTARADFYDPAYGHEVIDVAMTNGRISTTMQYVIQLEPPDPPETVVDAYPYPAPAGGSLLIPISDLGIECAACEQGGAIEAFSVTPAGAADLTVTETHVVVRPRASFAGALTIALRFADQYGGWSQQFELEVPVSRLTDEAPVALATYAEMPAEPVELAVEDLVAGGDADGIEIVGCGAPLHGSVGCGAGQTVRYTPSGQAAADQFSVHLMRGPDVLTASVTFVRADAETGLPTSGLAPLQPREAEWVPKAELEAAQQAQEEAEAQAAEAEGAAGEQPSEPAGGADQGESAPAELVGMRTTTPLAPPPPPEGGAERGGIFTAFVDVLNRMGS